MILVFYTRFFHGTRSVNDYCTCVQLQNGIKSAVGVARARKVEGCFFANTDILWGQQVAVMFQIVSTMALELPSFLGKLEELRGMSSNV